MEGINGRIERGWSENWGKLNGRNLSVGVF